MYRWVGRSKMPRFLKVLIYVVLTLSCIYWIGYFVYALLNGTRFFIHWVTEKSHFWVFMFCIVLVIGTSIFIAQKYLGLNPIGQIKDYFVGIYERAKMWLQNKLFG